MVLNRTGTNDRYSQYVTRTAGAFAAAAVLALPSPAAGQDTTVAPGGRAQQTQTAVSYTHLTLPTNREV